MGKSTRKKPIVWRETRPEYSADWNYSLIVRSRYSFFGCESPHNWKKALNFAAKFSAPNKICLLYIFGIPKGGIEAVRKAVKLFPGHIVCAVYADIPESVFDALSAYEKERRELNGIGYLDGCGNVTSFFEKEMREVYKAVYERKIPKDNALYIQVRRDRMTIRRHRNVLSRISEAQKAAAVCISNFSDKTEIIPDDETLKEIAKSLFPSGLESDTNDDSAAKLTTAKRIVNSAAAGDYSKLGITLREGIVQYSLFDDFTNGATELVEYIKEFCEERIKTRGYFHIAEAWYVVTKPPFGAYDCSWYLYLFAIAIRKYFTADYWWIVKIISVAGNDLDLTKTIMVQSQMRASEAAGRAYTVERNPYIVYVEDENSVKLAGLVSRLFDVPEKRPYCRYNAHKHLNDATMEARRWCEENVQTPLACVDERFYELLETDEYKWCERGAADKFVEWLETDFDDLYQKIRTVDADFDNQIIPIYGAARVKVWRKCHYVKGGAVGWVQSKEFFIEGVESYMKCVTCRECGRVIQRKNPSELAAQEFTESGEELEFTAKDIIGANKKFLGRYQEEFFCLKCLCEVLDCTPEALHEKIEAFKEQGCTLFG